MSSPMIFLSSGSKSKSHSFTGSLPVSVLKKQAGNVFRSFVIQGLCTVCGTMSRCLFAVVFVPTNAGSMAYNHIAIYKYISCKCHEERSHHRWAGAMRPQNGRTEPVVSAMRSRPLSPTRKRLRDFVPCARKGEGLWPSVRGVPMLPWPRPSCSMGDPPPRPLPLQLLPLVSPTGRGTARR